MEYRKAIISDINCIAQLVTDLIGSCNIKSKKSILETNIEDITKDINNYYVCIIDGKIVGTCGISNVIKSDKYNLNLKNIREILYLAVDKKYQGRGIGTNLLKLCSCNNKYDILYEAWGDNGKYVNSKFILKKCGYELIKNLGNNYYRKNNYCPKCVNRDKNCNKCIDQIWIKHKYTNLC